MTTPMRILLSSNPVRLTVELDGEGIRVLHRGHPISPQDGLQIFLENEAPVTIVLHDFEVSGRQWTVTAIGDAQSENTPWSRADGRCLATWGSTPERRSFVVVATPEVGAERRQPILAEVLPEGAKPWP